MQLNRAPLSIPLLLLKRLSSSRGPRGVHPGLRSSDLKISKRLSPKTNTSAHPVAQLSMSSLAQLSFWLAILFASVSAQGTFIQPPQPGTTGDFSNDPTYRIGENMTVKWDSNLQSMDLRLFQQYPLADGAWQYTNIECRKQPTCFAIQRRRFSCLKLTQYSGNKRYHR